LATAPVCNPCSHKIDERRYHWEAVNATEAVDVSRKQVAA
jgi:hypothetical protein